jgi:hypothetical protein
LPLVSLKRFSKRCKSSKLSSFLSGYRIRSENTVLVGHKGEYEVNTFRIAALILIAAGILGLAYGSFTYTRATHEAKLGPLELSMKDKETVNIPVWAGVGALVMAGVLLFVGEEES